MSAFDPSLDPSLDRNPAWPDERELAMLRHDVGQAFDDLAGGVRQLEAVELDLDGRAQLDRISASAKALECMIGRAIGGSGDSLCCGEVDLDLLMAHMRHRFTGAAREIGAAFRIEIAPALPTRLRLDPTVLSRILGNLVGSTLGRVEGGTVALAASAGQDEILFLVAGDRPARLAGSPSPPAPDGTGVGEAIVRSLASKIGGRVELDPEGRIGGLLRFPLSVAAGSGPFVPADVPRLTGLRVLLAEDNPTNQMVASNMLRALEAEVMVCADGVEALACFETFPADLVVVDIEMPRLTGLDVIRAIRARTDGRAHVPIVALTAYAMHEHRDRISAAGANGLIPKPVTSIETLAFGLAAHVHPGSAAAPVNDDPAVGTDAASPVIDTTAFDELFRTIGADLVGELMGKVVADLVDGRARLVGALAPLDRTQIQQTSHILISVAGAFGAVRLQARARSLNTNVQDPAVPREAIEQEVRFCLGEIDAAVSFARARAGVS